LRGERRDGDVERRDRAEKMTGRRIGEWRRRVRK
jgi:hypothetical protein